MAIMLGEFFDKSKIIISGRNEEIDRLIKEVKSIPSSLYEEKNQVLSVEKFSQKDVRILTCWSVCGKDHCHYESVTDDINGSVSHTNT